MTPQQDNSKDTFLTAQEQAACMQKANSETLHGQRAQALLALNEGNTLSQAAKKAGLSAGQVKYWVARFRKAGLDIFPDAIVEEIVTKDVSEAETETKKKSKTASGKEDSAQKTKLKDSKAKKGKKSKDKKSEKKTKKDNKKDKKSKKTKKKPGKAKKGRKSK
jgi:hypothetical protein